QDAEKPPPKNGIIFMGSSSIRFWDLKTSFPDLPAVNRGFGGSTIPDCTHFVARTVLKHEPRLVVFYAGDNDLAIGRSPEQVADDFKAFVRAVHEKLPKTRVAFISIKPSPTRQRLAEQQRRANALVEGFCKSDERLTYVDVVKPMLSAEGKPRWELFRADGLHLNDKGYELWALVVQVQAVRPEQLPPRLALGTQHRLDHVNVGQPLVRLAEPFDQGVRAALLLRQSLAGGAGLDRNERHPRLRQLLVHGPDERLEVIGHLLRAAADRQVVVAGVEDHQPRLVLEDGAGDEVRAVGDGRAAEAAVDGRQIRERRLEVPEADAGAAHKDDPVLRRRLLGVL